MENKNTGYIVVIIILSLLVLGLGGFIVYDKVISNDEPKITNNDVKENEEKDTNEVADNKEIKIETAVDYVDDHYKEFYVKLPKVVGKGEKIDEFNKKILNEMLPKTISNPVCRAALNGECMDKGATMNYKYLTKDNILIIYVYTEIPEDGMAAPQSGSGLYSGSFFYDIENDKILTADEIAKKFNLVIHDDEGNSYMIIIENNELKVEMVI